MISNKNKSKLIKYLAFILVIFIFSILASDFFALSKFAKALSGNVTAQIAEEKFSTTVEPVQASDDEINPYVLVTVKNNDESGVSDVSENFILEVTSIDGDELPDYHWEDLSGENLGKTATGNFVHSEEQEKQFKLIFENEASVEIVRQIKILTEVNQIQ